MSGKWITGSVAIAALLFSAAAHAKSPSSGFYLGASAGQSKYKEDFNGAELAIIDAFSDFGIPVGAINADNDDTDTSFNVFVGYRFLPWVAAEVGYVDLGELSYRANFQVFGGGAPTPGSADLTFSSKGALGSALAIWPVNDAWDLYARAGVFIENTELEATARILTISDTESQKSTTADSMIGIGTAVNLGQHFSLRAEYQHFGAVGDEDTGESDVDLFNVGFLLRF
jgi:OmpA-OmpF porin, OOP family